jgi:hypothetical protein
MEAAMASEESYEETRFPVCGPGGNKQLVNNDEEDIFDQYMSGVAMRTEGMQEPGRH